MTKDAAFLTNSLDRLPAEPQSAQNNSQALLQHDTRPQQTTVNVPSQAHANVAEQQGFSFAPAPAFRNPGAFGTPALGMRGSANFPDASALRRPMQPVQHAGFATPASALVSSKKRSAREHDSHDSMAVSGLDGGHQRLAKRQATTPGPSNTWWSKQSTPQKLDGIHKALPLLTPQGSPLSIGSTTPGRASASMSPLGMPSASGTSAPWLANSAQGLQARSDAAGKSLQWQKTVRQSTAVRHHPYTRPLAKSPLSMPGSATKR